MDSFADTAATARGQSEPGMLASESFWSWEQDRHLRYTHVVPVGMAPTFDPRRVIGRTRWQLPEARPLQGTWAEHRHVLSGRLPFQNFQYLVFMAGRAPRCLSESGEPLFDAAGRFTGYRGTARDITQQWLHQVRLQETQGLLQAAARLARFGAWSIGVAAQQATWGTEAGTTLSATGGSGSAHADAVLALYAPEDRPRLAEAYARCVREGTPFDLELQALTAHGRRMWLRVIGVAVRGPDGAVVRVHGAYQDIHKAKLAAEEQRESAQRLRMTLDSLSDGFLTVDRQWRITYVNPAAESILALDADSMTGRGMWDVFPEAEHGEFGSHYREAMDAGRIGRFEAFYPPLAMWFRVSTFPSRQGIAISFTDITSAREAREQLLRANAQLEERVRERTRELQRSNDELASFTQALTHEMRAPLAGIDGFSRALAELLSGRDDAKPRHYLRRIRAGVLRMEHMLQGLVELARVGRMPLAPRTVDLSAIAQCTVEALRASAPGRHADVVVQDGLTAPGDARLVRTLLENLLGNAWKFSAGRQPARIEFGRNAEGVFFVRDNGAGFDAAEASGLFAPFRQLHAAEAFGGVGIGLASARRVVERHGGLIWGESVEDGWTAFYFTLPG